MVTYMRLAEERLSYTPPAEWSMFFRHKAKLRQKETAAPGEAAVCRGEMGLGDLKAYTHRLNRVYKQTETKRLHQIGDPVMVGTPQTTLLFLAQS